MQPAATRQAELQRVKRPKKVPAPRKEPKPIIPSVPRKRCVPLPLHFGHTPPILCYLGAGMGSDVALRGWCVRLVYACWDLPQEGNERLLGRRRVVASNRDERHDWGC